MLDAGGLVAVAPVGFDSCCEACRLVSVEEGGNTVVAVDDDDGDGAVDCGCLPGVFNISIRLLSIKCSLKESVLPNGLACGVFDKSLEETFAALE